MSILDFIMRQPIIYRLWMATHGEKKFAKIAKRIQMDRISRVLDVGCGPGTNANYFSKVEYLGIDLNDRYIRDAERRYGDSPGGRRFLAVDAAKFVAPPDKRFDFVLVNSFLHHVDEATAKGILSNLSKLLTEDGRVHIIELVMPESHSLARIMARLDRGDFPRPLEKWRQMFSEYFDPVSIEPFDLVVLGLPFWRMVYFSGKART